MFAKVYVEITNICNMHCSFCHGHSRAPRRMTEEAFRQLLPQLTGQTQYLYYHLMGEPLTHPDLPRFIEIASEQGFRSILTTNGTLLAKRQMELLSSKLHKVNISVHSFEDGTEEAYLQYLREITDFADAASKAGSIVVLRLWNKDFDQGRNRQTEAYFREHLDGEWMPNTRGVRIRNKLHLEWGERFDWPDEDAPDQGNQVSCYGLRDHFGILCDGSVVPCCMDSNGVMTLGNVFQEDLREILSSPRAEAIRAGFAKREAVENLCRRCGYARRFS